MGKCNAKIAPFPDKSVIVLCDRSDERHDSHTGTLLNYAGPGSKSNITWWEEDRRNFRGEYIPCDDNRCTLPKDHRGQHAY